MATHTVTTMTDDLDGGPAHRTVRFGYQGLLYEIDLSEGNAAAFDAALGPFLENARVIRGRPLAPRPPTADPGPDPRIVRAWARENGVAVPPRGRVPGSVVAAYLASGPTNERPTTGAPGADGAGA